MTKAGASPEEKTLRKAVETKQQIPQTRASDPETDPVFLKTTLARIADLQMKALIQEKARQKFHRWGAIQPE